MPRWHYDTSGLHVESSLELPEWAADERPAPRDPPDVRIRLGPSRADGGGATIDATQCCFHVSQTASYRVSGGTELVIEPVPGADSSAVRLFALGSAWGALLHQRGALALHAGVVSAGAGAVAFCGAQGAGKSSTVAWLVERGHALVSDDLCRVDIGAGALPRVWRSAPRLKLADAALSALSWDGGALRRDHPDMDKFQVEVERRARPDPLPLRAVYLLEWGEPSLRRLTGVDGLRRLVAAGTYRGELLEPMGRLAEHWERCAALMRVVPVWELRRPREWSSLESAMALLPERLAAPA